MDKTTGFIREFIAADAEIRRAVYAAPDRDAFAQRVRAFGSFFDEREGAMGFSENWRFIDPSDNSDIAVGRRRILAHLSPRILFLIRRYEHGRFHALDRCYLNSGRAGSPTKYFESFFVANTDRGLRIVACWGVCVTCRGSGHLDTEACYSCNGTGWEWAGGARLGDLGRVTKVERFEAPTDPTSLADYQRD